MFIVGLIVSPSEFRLRELPRTGPKFHTTNPMKLRGCKYGLKLGVTNGYNYIVLNDRPR